ncbi:zinc-dependent alcohol dehydrogenase [Arthrobacter sp. VKM Ac-2550]|uniref:zinc-dependent alcohol dehydrogenase n=1 Tax=Crystallibacter permensis TaxID=1938888 RepID=UPI0022263F8F|nr:alcohol dehydrogenase catalytic domain-containing protein [Arthrobacter sp. VKM Ac-2550]MCW2135337.1 2-desacetyl-2-hydroxyethyl bacteriochlorophyllide A dehydrogenase [Arthrobacter sp. VKM Ac-2550]
MALRAARYIGDQRIEVGNVEGKPPAAGEVAIRVAYNGICGTDLHIVQGHMDTRVAMPAVIGHEMSGIISAIGSDVESLTPGQPVTVMPLRWCGECASCRAGHQHICQRLDFVGIDSPGALQEQWTVPASLVVPLPEGISLEHAALVEPLAVAVHDVRRSRLVAGETAVVIGGGPIGQLIAVVARAEGAEVVLAEPDAVRRAFAAQQGAIVVDPIEGDLAAVVEERTSGAGADVVFEVAGTRGTALDATRHARTRGRVVFVAIHPEPVPVDLHRIFWRELEVLGARVYEREDFERAIELLASGAVPADALITRVVPLDDASEAFEALLAASAMKILVDVQGVRA